MYLPVGISLKFVVFDILASEISPFLIDKGVKRSDNDNITCV